MTGALRCVSHGLAEEGVRLHVSSMGLVGAATTIELAQSGVSVQTRKNVVGNRGIEHMQRHGYEQLSDHPPLEVFQRCCFIYLYIYMHTYRVLVISSFHAACSS